MSEIKVPTTVNVLRINTMLPARNISWLKRAPTKSGATVGIPRTNEASSSPFTSCGSVQPMVLTTGRQLEHWHTGAMTRRASYLDALEPEATASLNPKELRRLGVTPGEPIRVMTRRGAIELRARADRAVPEGVLFIPFAYVEAAANILTNPQLDPYGKIPEFKFCAARVEKAAQVATAAE